MDDIWWPVRFEGITEEGLKEHLRYCASSFKLGDRAEFLLCDVGVVIPLVKSVRRNKPSTLDMLLRSGSIRRDQLEELRTSLSAAGYDPKISLTSKKKLLKRVVVPLNIEDGFIAVTGLNVIRLVASALGLPWPCRLAIGYPLGLEKPHLPGELIYRDTYTQAGYRFGYAVGKLFRRIIS
ncbi:MAG TPA: hypothetical protein VJM50_04215 [Pyrinomonadaceae bacterium]|nr:hypothetical protein [Pyrinomonadaceae bacterium]